MTLGIFFRNILISYFISQLAHVFFLETTGYFTFWRRKRFLLYRSCFAMSGEGLMLNAGYNTTFTVFSRYW